MEVVAEESNVKLEIHLPVDVKLAEDSATKQEFDNEIPRYMNEVETRPQIKQEVESEVYSVRCENIHDTVKDIEPGFQQDESEDICIKEEVDEEIYIKQEGAYEFVDGTENIKQEVTSPQTITEPVAIATTRKQEFNATSTCHARYDQRAPINNYQQQLLADFMRLKKKQEDHRRSMEEIDHFIVQKVSHTYTRSKKTKTCVDDSFDTQSKNGRNTDVSNEVKKMTILDESSLQDMNPAQSSDTQIDLPEPTSQGLSANEVSAGLKRVREYSCDVCLFKSRTKCKLDYHYYCAHPDVHDRYKCAKCDFSTNRRDRLMQHCMMKHICKYKCTFKSCKIVCPSKSALQIHMNIHLGVKDYLCSHCDFKAVSKYAINLHKVRHQDVAKYQCDKCGKQFKGHQSLLLHIDRMHPAVDREYKCGECDFTSNLKERLWRHKMYRHICKHKCQYENCKLAFGISADLKRHMNSHLGVKPYQCSQCDFKAVTKGHIKRHELRHQDACKFQCPKCFKRFKRHISFIRHKDTHEDKYQFQCDHCPFKTRQRSNLQIHARIHSGEKPYLCDTCGYRTCYPALLTNHKCRV